MFLSHHSDQLKRLHHCRMFGIRPVGSVRERPGGHLRMRVSPKWVLRGFGRVGKTVII